MCVGGGGGTHPYLCCVLIVWLPVISVVRTDTSAAQRDSKWLPLEMYKLRRLCSQRTTPVLYGMRRDRPAPLRVTCPPPVYVTWTHLCVSPVPPLYVTWTHLCVFGGGGGGSPLLKDCVVERAVCPANSTELFNKSGFMRLSFVSQCTCALRVNAVFIMRLTPEKCMRTIYV